MANSTINIELFILDEPVVLEVEVTWYYSESNELTIDDFTAYAIVANGGDGVTYERIPYWLHKLIESTKELDNYQEEIESHCDENK